jgi:glucose/mannose transport system substrate-binding protein
MSRHTQPDFLTRRASHTPEARGTAHEQFLRNITFRHGLTAVCLALVAPLGGAQTLDVMHWWTSASERAAANQLVQTLQQQGVRWQDAAVEGGGGGAAVKVLKSRVLSGSPPAAAQLIGKMLTDWADLGLVLPLNRVAEQGAWQQQFFPEVLSLVTHQGQRIAVPLGIHRINVVLYQRRLFERLRLTPPRDWSGLERVAQRLKQAGVTPLAWSDEPWQVATVFESVLLSHAGPDLYTRLVRAQEPEAWKDPKVEAALNRLRWLRELNGPMPRKEVGWIQSVEAFDQGKVGMLINGDWAQGELRQLTPMQPSFLCAPIPGTDGMHLYSIDTLTMLKGTQDKTPVQEKAAGLLGSAAVQRPYNQVKGSVPVRKDIDPQQLDECQRQSWQTFANPQAYRVPSLAHRMAASEATKEAIAGIVQSFVLRPGMTPAEAQRQLVSVVRAMLKENQRP